MAYLLTKGGEFRDPNRYGIKLVLGLSTAAIWYRMLRTWMVRRGVANKIKHKKAQCATSFAKIEQDLTQLQLDKDECRRIHDLPLLELQQELQDGSVKAVDVLHIYQTQCLDVDKRLNAITEPLLDAETLATDCDALSGEKGLLHGVPVSLKENYNLDGLDSTAGLGQFLSDPKTEDAVLVKRYIQGFGSDIGGSIRVPSHFCGCYGLKTTLERLSRKGTFGLGKGQMQVSGTVGPMSRDLDGLVLAMKALLCDYHFELDPQVPPIKFRDQIYESKKPLRVGFYVHDGYLQAVPACQRAVMLAKQALEAQGHTVVEFTPPRVKYVMPHLYIKSVQGDGGRSYQCKLDNDIVDPTIKKLMMPATLPKWLLWLLSWVLQTMTKDSVLGEVLRCRIGVRSVYGWFQHAVKLQEYKYEFLHAWKSKDLDAVICPPFATTAVPHRKVMDVIGAGGYSWLYNVLNYPAGSLPVTKVTIDDVSNMKDYPNKTACEKSIRKVTVGSEDLPVNVQCVALPFQEELVLRVMKEVETGLKNMKK